MKPEDVLADEVHDCGVLAPEELPLLGALQGSPVVHERVEPDVHHVPRIAGHRDAPGEPRARDGEVLESTGDEAHDLVAPALGLDETRVLFVVPEERAGVLLEPEEIRLVLHQLDRRPVDGTDVARLEEVLLGLELLAADAVPALVRAEIDVLRMPALDLLPEPLRAALVSRLGRPDEVVRLDLELRPGGAEASAHLIDEDRRRHAPLLRFALDLEAVLVGPGEHARGLAAEGVVPPEGVRRDRRVGRPEVGNVVDVVDGRRDVEAAHRASGLAQRRARRP